MIRYYNDSDFKTLFRNMSDIFCPWRLRQFGNCEILATISCFKKFRADMTNLYMTRGVLHWHRGSSQVFSMTCLDGVKPQSIIFLKVYRTRVFLYSYSCFYSWIVPGNSSRQNYTSHLCQFWPMCYIFICGRTFFILFIWKWGLIIRVLASFVWFIDRFFPCNVNLLRID